MNIDFSDKVVLVTGASAGIGEAIALLFAQLGAKLAIVGRNESNLKDVASRCEQEKGQKAFAIVADLSTDEGCEKTASETIKCFGRLDVLVNNAGIGARTCIERADMASFDRVFNTNVRGVYCLTRLLVPAIIEAKGNIVNISSIIGTAVAVGRLPYSMSKAALDHFSKIISLELAPKGVRVNTVSPGITRSKMVQRITNCSDAEYEAWLKEAADGYIPLGKVCSGEDVARAVVYLASEASALVTGTVLQVDGGLQFATGHRPPAQPADQVTDH